MGAYDSLSLFDDARALLRTLTSSLASSSPAVRAVVFSNGTPAMLEQSIAASPELRDSVICRRSGDDLPPFVSVDQVQRYKPAPETYAHLLRAVGKTPEQARDVVLVSGNPFDIVGARAAGLRAVWVDRAGVGWADGLGQPDHSVRTLGDVLAVIGG